MMIGGAGHVLAGAEATSLFDRIGRFLADQRLSPLPQHYTFAYHVVSDPDGALAQAVAAITDGGVRLSQHDIAALGGDAAAGAPILAERIVDQAPMIDMQIAPVDTMADGLIARAQVQVEGFAHTVRTMHAEASGFGRDLEASAAAIRSVGRPAAGIDEIARLTGAMIERVHSAEVRLAAATRETDELRSALDEARGSARQDPLTELANRRAFDEAYAAVAPGAPVTVAVCDIDHFKRVNDDFGHAVGDRVLKAIAQTLAGECEGHLVARYGGEEFALLFAGVEIDGARVIVERARGAIAARRFRSRETDAPIGTITVSAGLAAGAGGDQQGTLLARADAALYAAKANGRNRVMPAPNLGE